MRIARDELRALASVLDALRPYLPELILIGGWAHRLFGLHPWARPRDFAPLVTNDVDFAVPVDVQAHEPAPISTLLEQAGFQADLKSIHTRPPVTRYRRAGLLVEFVADLKGSPTSRKGEAKEVAALAGITAEQLRYVYPLHLNPWSPPRDAELPSLADARVVHPVTYLFQKILVNQRRLPPKDANDVLYIADTADVFGDRLDALRDEWTGVLEKQIHANHVVAFRKAAKALMTPGEVHRRASKIAESVGRPRTPEQLAEIVGFVTRTVLGP